MCLVPRARALRLCWAGILGTVRKAMESTGISGPALHLPSAVRLSHPKILSPLENLAHSPTPSQALFVDPRPQVY